MKKFVSLYAGVYVCTVGKPSGGFCNERFEAPREEALSAMGNPSLPAQAAHLSAVRKKGGWLLRVPLGDGERIYGMGLQYFRQNQRGRTRWLRVNSDPCADNGESNAPVPYYVSTSGYGLLVDTARIVTVWCGSDARLLHKPKLGEKDCVSDESFTWTPPADEIEIFIPGNGARIYIFAGKDPAECVCRYNLFSGGGCMPPLWALGLWHRVGREYTQSQVLAEADKFRKNGYPCDVIGLEPGWQSNSYPCSLEWSDRFPAPAAMCACLREKGFYVNTWQHLYLSEKSGIYDEMLEHCGDYTVWGGIVPDLCDAAAIALLRRQWKEHQLGAGVSGMKLDECDGSELTKFSWIFPPHAQFFHGGSGEEFRQKMGALYQQAVAKAYRDAGVRTFGLARASGAYAAPLPFGIYTDLYDHRQYIRALINAGYSGLVWVPEVRGADNAEDWLRRFQTAVFSPILQLNGWYDKLLPWSFADAAESVRRLLEWRMRLIPYIYTLFYEYFRTGMPVYRPMNVAFGAQAGRLAAEYARVSGYKKVHPWDVFEDELDGQYMFGPSLLVAPLVSGEREKIVWLPPGTWYDLFTGEPFEGGVFLKRRYETEQFPVFVRGGTVLPLAEPSLCTAQMSGEIEAVVFGAGHAEGLLYEDDGKTENFRSGELRILRLSTDGEGTEKIEQEGCFAGRYTVRKWTYRK